MFYKIGLRMNEKREEEYGMTDLEELDNLSQKTDSSAGVTTFHLLTFILPTFILLILIVIILVILAFILAIVLLTFGLISLMLFIFFMGNDHFDNLEFYRHFILAFDLLALAHLAFVVLLTLFNFYSLFFGHLL